MAIHFENILQLLQFALLLLDLGMRLGVYLAQQESCYVEYLLQLLGTLELHMTQFIAIIFLKDLKESVGEKGFILVDREVSSW